MAKRKIIWSHPAQIRFNEILQFYIDRNQSKAYSKKLFSRINKELKLLRTQPEMGILSEEDGVRGVIIGDYILFYEYTSTLIFIHTIWDCRQDPEKLKIK